MKRRDFIKISTQVSAGALLATKGIVHAQGSDRIRVGLIGCGSRGTGAGIINCAQSAPGVELVAMGDLFQDHMDAASERIVKNLQKKELPVDEIYKVTPEYQFVGFDAYKKVIASSVDMVILATPPFFRPEHLRAAVSAGKHVFIEKPVATDPAGVRSVLESADLAKEKGLTLVAGTQRRRMRSFRETIKRIHDGAIGQICSGQCVRSGNAMRDWRSDERLKSGGWTDMEYHIRRWLFWTWLAGDFINEMHIHNLDSMNWILNAHPIQCVGVGGRQVRVGLEYGNVFDHFAVEYLYPNDVRIQYIGTQMDGVSTRNDQRVQGTAGSAYLDSGNGLITGKSPYQFEGDQPDPAVLEYTEMIDSIRRNKALNEGRQVAESTMTAILGRMSAYTGRALKWDWAMNASKLDFSPVKMEFGDLPAMPVAIPGVTELI